jgi:GDP-mannose 4,6-dehydratase
MITGVHGFVAVHLANHLLECGDTVVGTARWQEGSEPHDERIKVVPMDLNDLSSCIAAVKSARPDAIYHLAAESYVHESFTCPEQTLRTNVLGTYNLLEAVRILGADPVVHVCSSSEVYGQVEPHEVPITEDQPFRPASPYGVSKVGEDLLGKMYYDCYGLKVLRTRMFTHSGPGRTMASAESSFARQLARIELGKQPAVIKHGNLDSVRTWADVRDAVKAYRLLVTKCPAGAVYNIGGTTVKTVGECLDQLLWFRKVNRIKKELDPTLLRPMDVTLQVPDCSVFKAVTGWEPRITFEQTMKDLLDWHRTREGMR